MPLMNSEYLEKYCTDKVNELGKKLRKNPQDPLYNGQFDAYTQVLMIIAQEVAYEREQV